LHLYLGDLEFTAGKSLAAEISLAARPLARMAGS
jgi:hypothetical protein